MKLKSALSIALSVTLTAGTFILPISAKTSSSINTVSSYSMPASSTDFTILDGKLMKYTGSGGDIVIPNSVKIIGGKAFFECGTITSVVIPDSVTSIEESAFSGCSALAGVTLPSSITEIKSWTFDNCRALESITIPDGVLSIGYEAFSGCFVLNSITIPGSVKTIGLNAFNQTPWLDKYPGVFVIAGNNILIKYKGSSTGVVIPSSVKSIGSGAFRDCASLKSISLPTGITSIGDEAFYFCKSLASINIPNSVVEIGEGAFLNCSSLKSISIPSSVKSIGSGAFSGCIGLTALTIPSEYYVFQSCNALKSVVIPSNIVSIGYDSFAYCENLISVTIPSSVKSIGDQTFEECSKLVTVKIPSSVTSIGNNTFSETLWLDKYPGNFVVVGNHILLKYKGTAANVTIPNGVITIGGLAFYNNKTLKSVKIPSSVTQIGISAFNSCSGLVSIIIPSSVKSLGLLAFFGCASLKSITIPSSITSIESNAFDETYWLKNYSGNFVVAGNKILIKYKGSSANVAIPVGVKSIGPGSFSGCQILKSLIIPNTVTAIKDNAFMGCNSLTTIIIPSSVKSLGAGAFSECSTLKSVTITGKNTSVSEYALNNCNILTFRCPEDSFAEAYAYDQSFLYSIIVPVTSIQLNISSLPLTAGKSGTIAFTIAPIDTTTNTVSWQSSNTGVAAVDSSGKVTAKSIGTATITCTAKDGSGIQALCAITVIPLTPTGFTAAKASATSIKLKWGSVSGVTGYEVYRSASLTGSYTKVKVLTLNTFTDTSLTGGKTYFYKIRAYKTVGGVPIRSTFSTVAYIKL